MKIKAGTYKFKDLVDATIDAAEIEINFTAGFAIDIQGNITRGVFNCSKIIFESDSPDHIIIKYYVDSANPNIDAILAVSGSVLPNAIIVHNDAWFTGAYGDEIRTFTLAGDVDVPDNFYLWFVNNVEPTSFTINAKVSLLVDRANKQTGASATDLSTAVSNLINLGHIDIPSAIGVKF
jgi:hypothetical protein